MDLNNMMGNQYAHGIKKFTWEILKERYAAQEQAVERISRAIMTARDYEEVAKLFLAVYESGYFEAVQQHKEILKSHGLEVNVTHGEVPPNPNAAKIFKS